MAAPSLHTWAQFVGELSRARVAPKGVVWIGPTEGRPGFFSVTVDSEADVRPLCGTAHAVTHDGHRWVHGATTLPDQTMINVSSPLVKVPEAVAPGDGSTL